MWTIMIVCASLNCPTLPSFQGVFDSEEACETALQHVPLMWQQRPHPRDDTRLFIFRCVVQSDA